MLICGDFFDEIKNVGGGRHSVHIPTIQQKA